MLRVQSLSALEANQPQRFEEVQNRLEGLLRQEEQHYLCSDYIHTGQQLQQQQQGQTTSAKCLAVEQCARIVSDLAFSPPSEESMHTTYPSAVCVRDLADSQVRASFVADENSAATPNLVGFWRQQMLDWSNLVMDSFGIDREVVAVSFNILDRYVAQEIQSNIPITREDFQLFSMTSLFIAVKLLETYPRKLTADALVDMSRGFYASEDILHTEREILKTLGFYLNPTTAIGFCRIYWDIFPVPLTFEFKATCQTMAEMALADTFFLTKKPSLVGLAAILHAARIEGCQSAMTEKFLSDLRSVINVQNSEDFDAIYNRLELLSHSGR